jgi:lysophospholipase L1-like esterase
MTFKRTTPITALDLDSSDLPDAGPSSKGGVTLDGLDARFTNPNLAGLRAWRAALGGRYYAPADIVVIGDSLTEGQGVTVSTRRYIDRMLAQLRTSFPSGAVGGSGYISAGHVATGFTAPWTLAGGATQTLYGLGLRGAQMTGSGHTISITQTCTSFKIFYIQGASNTGPFTVAVDGGGATTVTPSTSGGFNVSSYTSGALSAASHTIELAYGGSQTAFILGGMFFNGDESIGVRLIESGHYGYKTSDYSAAMTGGTLPGGNFMNSHWAALPNAPSLVIIHLGLNDYQTNVAPATVQTNIQTMIAAVKTIHTGKSWAAPSFLVVAPYKRTDVTSPTYAWTSYITALEGIAAADPTNVGFLNLTDRVDMASATYGLLAGDNIHPTEKGHGWLGDVVASALTAA